MSKTYDLDVQPMLEFEGTGEHLGYYSKGHFDTERFIANLVEMWEPAKKPTAEEVVREWRRLVPAGDGSGAMLFKPAQAGARGAFLVMVWEA